MAKDAVETMGGLLPEDVGGRDAVHVAVFSAVSEERLYPGQPVVIIEQMEVDTMVASRPSVLDTGGHVALVDPYLPVAVLPGERFWAYLMPRTITALSHRWSHPAFEASSQVYVAPSDKLESEKWLRDFCETANCPGYQAVMDRIREGIGLDEYLYFKDQDAGGDIPGIFWDHVECVIGEKLDHRPAYFSCAC